MKPLHKSILIWASTIQGVLAVAQQQTAPLDPNWALGIACGLAAVVAFRQYIDAHGLPDVNAARALLSSLPLWCTIAMPVLTVLQQDPSRLPAGLATTLTTVLAVLPVIQRGNAALYADPPPKPRDPPTALPTILVLAFVAIGAITAGCSAPQWPKGCAPVDRDGLVLMRCECDPFTHHIGPVPGKLRPAGLVQWTCGGDPFPIEVQSADVNLPPCQP